MPIEDKHPTSSKTQEREDATRYRKELEHCKDFFESQKVYDEWSRTFDEDNDLANWTGPAVAARLLEKHLTDLKTSCLLDVGSGKYYSLLKFSRPC